MAPGHNGRLSTTLHDGLADCHYCRNLVVKSSLATEDLSARFPGASRPCCRPRTERGFNETAAQGRCCTFGSQMGGHATGHGMKEQRTRRRGAS